MRGRVAAGRDYNSSGILTVGGTHGVVVFSMKDNEKEMERYSHFCSRMKARSKFQW
jgi:hypothetical protein